MKKYNTIQEVADTYSVTKQTIRNWIKRGLPHIKVGNVLRFDLQEVDKWIHENTKEN